MRNLKRALSLALASVMVLGLMIVGSSAKTSQFADADKVSEDYTEAIDVLTTIGVLEGVEDGTNFDPQGTLTREMAAKILSVMRLGAETAERLGSNTQIFKDVAATRWSAGYIAYCTSTGIIAGDGAGNFDPEGKLTGVAFGKMLLTALGYDAEVEGYVNTPAWSVNVAKDMVDNGVDVDGITLSEPITREQAAQMALNTIKTPIVEYEGRTQVNVNGAEIVVGGDEAKPVVNTVANENTISKDRLSNTSNYYTVEFGERFIKDLRLNNDDTDKFMRPSHTWVWKNEEIDTYIDFDKLVDEYTTAINGKTLYELLGKSTIADNYVEYYVNGGKSSVIEASNMVRTGTRNYSTTGNGILTQVFLDTDPEVETITIVSIYTFLAQATDDYDTDKQELAVDIKYRPAEGDDTDVSLDEVSGIEKYKEDDYFLVQVATDDDGTTYDIVDVFDVPNVVKGVKLNRYSSENYVVTSGSQYNYSFTGKDSRSAQDDLTDLAKKYNYDALDQTYDLFIDQYGYMIGNKYVDKTTHYLFLVGYDINGSHLANAYADANVIFLDDGTMSKVKVDVDGTNDNIDDPDGDGVDNPADFYGKLDGTGASEYNKWFTYEEDDGVYTLNPVGSWVNVEVNPGPLSINSRTFKASVEKIADGSDDTGIGTPTSPNKANVWGNDDSIYITVDTKDVSAGTDKGISKVTGTYTGLDGVDIDVDNKITVGSKMDGNEYKYSDTKIHEGSESHAVKLPDSMRQDVKNVPSMFVLYDEDQYVIGAIIIGDAGSSTSDYAYVLEAIDVEFTENDKDYWEFKAIVDGEVKTLTASDYVATAINDCLGYDHSTATPGESGLMILEFDSDGYVTKARSVATWESETGRDKIYDDDNFANELTDDFNAYDIEWNLSGSSNTELQSTTTLVNKGRTLWADETDMGLRQASDCPVWVVYKETYTSGASDKTIYKSYNTLQKAVEALTNNNANATDKFDGYVSAVLNEKGEAEYIVIKSLTAVEVNDNGGASRDPIVGPLPVSVDDYDVNEINPTVTIKMKSGYVYMGLENAKAAAAYALAQKGYTVTGWDGDSTAGADGHYTLKALAIKDGISSNAERTFTIKVLNSYGSTTYIQ